MAINKLKTTSIETDAITADLLATGAITVADITDGEITAEKLHTTLDFSTKTFTMHNNHVAQAMVTQHQTQLAIGADQIDSGSPTFGGDVGVTGTLTATQLGGNLDANTKNITNIGNVGIGTASPGYPLQVNGSVDILNVKGSTGNAFVRFTDSDATADFSIGADDSSGAGAGAFILYDRSNTAYRLVVDSSGNVGIGTTSIPSADSAYLTVGTQDYAISHNGFSKNSYFDGSSYTAVTNSAGKLIQMGDDIVFYHAPTVAAGAAQTLDEVMSIKSATSEPILNVTGAGYGYTHGAMALKSDTGYDARVRGQGIFLFNEENDTTWYAGTPYLNTTAGSRPFDFNFKSSTTSLSAITAYSPTYTAFRVHASGVISTPGGIELGSGVDATAANTLDDYEEGTFTPSIVNGWGILNPTYSTNSGFYTKVGNIVHVAFRITLSGGSTNANGLRLNGLPFTVGATTNVGTKLSGWFATASSNAENVFLGLEANDVNPLFYYKNANGTSTFLGTDAGTSFSMTFSGTYQTA